MATGKSHVDPLTVYAAHPFADDQAYQVSGPHCSDKTAVLCADTGLLKQGGLDYASLQRCSRRTVRRVEGSPSDEITSFLLQPVSPCRLTRRAPHWEGSLPLRTHGYNISESDAKKVEKG
jgi:hypothetical protein